MNAKKVLFLGAAPTQIPPIHYARDKGYYIVTCDYLPDNPGHQLADESYNVSTTDKSAVLELAQKLRIDGIVAYASDPAAPTAAYVAEYMGLPGNPYQAVLTLARKDLFREFLFKNGFNTPKSKSFYDRAEAREWLEEIGIPAYIKPVDSSGSKGVTRLSSPEHYEQAFDHALSFSRERKVVIEEEISRSGYQVAGDGFIVDGELKFRCWANEHFDKLCNGLVPIGESFPTTQPDNSLAVAHAETQRLLTLLGMRMGALNFDFVFTKDGKFYFLELGPRNGGCLIPEVIRYATGKDLIGDTVDAALGHAVNGLSLVQPQGYWSSYMVHAVETGTYKELWLSDRIKPKIVEQDIWVKSGDPVCQFNGSNHTLGTMIIKFDSSDEMLDTMDNMERDIRVVIE